MLSHFQTNYIFFGLIKHVSSFLKVFYNISETRDMVYVEIYFKVNGIFQSAVLVENYFKSKSAASLSAALSLTVSNSYLIEPSFELDTKQPYQTSLCIRWRLQSLLPGRWLGTTR